MRADLRRISRTHGWCSSPRSSRCECSRTRIYPRRISRTRPSADRANNSRDWLRKRGNDQKHVLTLQLQLCWALALLYLEHWAPPKGCSQVLYLLAGSCWDMNLGNSFHTSVGELTPCCSWPEKISLLLVRDRQVATRQGQGGKSDLIQWQDEIKVFVQGIVASQDSCSNTHKDCTTFGSVPHGARSRYNT